MVTKGDVTGNDSPKLCNVGTVLQPFETMSLRCAALKIVVATILQFLELHLLMFKAKKICLRQLELLIWLLLSSIEIKAENLSENEGKNICIRFLFNFHI